MAQPLRRTRALVSHWFWRIAGAGRPIRFLLLILAIPLLVAVLWATGLVLTQRTTENIEREEGDKLASEAKFFAGLTDLTIGRQLADLQTHARLIPTLGLLDQPSRFSGWMTSIQQSIPEYTWIGFADTQGVIRAATGKILVNQNVSDRPWFLAGLFEPVTIDVHEAVMLEPYLPAHHEGMWRFIDVAAPVKNAQGKPVGVLGAHLSWDWLVAQHRRFSETLLKSRDGDIIVGDEDGSLRLVGPSAINEPLNSLQSFQLAKNGASGWIKETWADGREYLVGYTRNPGHGNYHQLGWITLVRLPAENVSALITPAVFGMWAAMGSAILVFVVGLWWMSSVTLRPVQNLVNQVRRAADDGSAVDLSTPMPQEFAALGQAANQLLTTAEARKAAELTKIRLLAYLSHEIRTPLNGMLGRAELLKTRLQSPQDQHDLSQLIADTQALAKICNDGLDISMAGEDAMRFEQAPFHLSTLIDSCVDLVTPLTTEKNIALRRVDQFPPALVLRGDVRRLKQVLDNLLSNAIKFTAAGHVELVVTTTPVSSQQVLLDIQVSDTGVGMSALQQEEIFSRFTQAETTTWREFGGNGLGLALVNGLVTAMGGTITVNSEPRTGSRFILRITLDTDSVAPENQTGQLSPPTVQPASETLQDLPSLHVLVVDDIQTNREILVRWLELKGHRVEESVTGKNAFIKSAAWRFDLILLDVGLPDLSGLQVAELIRRSTGLSRNSPIVAVSGHAYPHDVAAAAEAGMNGHISKPIDFQRLQQLLQDLGQGPQTA
jgi:two-component system, sensor histidine kinase